MSPLTLGRAPRGAEAPRLGQGKAPAPREPGRGGGVKEVEKDRVAGGLRGRRRPGWDVRGGPGRSGVCLRRSVSKSVGPRAGFPCLQHPPATATGTGRPLGCGRQGASPLSRALHWVLPLAPPGPAWGRPSPPA
jgi:hypothetical protein